MDKFQAIIFYIVALTAVVGAFRAIFTRRIFNSVVYAFISFLAVGLLFFALELPYLGLVQVALCSVGMSILFVFAVALTEKNKQKFSPIVNKPRTYFSIIGLLMMTVLLACFLRIGSFMSDNIAQTTNGVIPSVKAFSVELFLSYGAPFVFSGLFFLAVILGFGVILSLKIGGKK